VTATAQQWVEGARPRTLPAAIAPVAVGTGAAVAVDDGIWGKALLALVVALALQVGVNYANDYSDGVRGTDATRVGPFRLVGSGAASPGSVRAAALAAFAVGAAAGLVLAATTSWWLLLVGAAALVAAWTYTGGPLPYGYRALGEVFVFLFFGLVAVLGTTYVQAGTVTWPAAAGAVAIGAWACAILVANNLRDIPTDTATGKRTLAVVLGARRSRILYAALVTLPVLACLAVAPAHPVTLIALATVPVAVRLARTVLGGASGRDLIPVLAGTGRAELVYAALFAVGLAVS
jgi:1,4-dihydroxy-2-naphthoate octaprenyltransferase